MRIPKEMLQNVERLDRINTVYGGCSCQDKEYYGGVIVGAANIGGARVGGKITASDLKRAFNQGVKAAKKVNTKLRKTKVISKTLRNLDMDRYADIADKLGYARPVDTSRTGRAFRSDKGQRSTNPWIIFMKKFRPFFQARYPKLAFSGSEITSYGGIVYRIINKGAQYDQELMKLARDFEAVKGSGARRRRGAGLKEVSSRYLYN